MIPALLVSTQPCRLLAFYAWYAIRDFSFTIYFGDGSDGTFSFFFLA